MLATFRAPVLALWPTQAARHGQPARACQRLVLRPGNMRQRLILWPPAVFLHATQYRWEFGWHWFPSPSGHLVCSAVCWTYLWTTEEWKTNISLCSFLFFGSYPFFFFNLWHLICFWKGSSIFFSFVYTCLERKGAWTTFFLYVWMSLPIFGSKDVFGRKCLTKRHLHLPIWYK